MSAKEDYYSRKTANEAQSKERVANTWRKKIKEPMTLFTALVALFTFLLFVVAALQWHTLEKTDATLRAGQRAFVFVKRPANNWTVAKKIGSEIVRSFYVEWENNGNSQAKNLKVTLWCPRPSAFNTIDPITANTIAIVEASRLLGPKQAIWGGVCNYKASELISVRDQSLPMFVAAKAVYSDIFGEKHVTEFCAQITGLTGDFEKLDVMPTNDLVNCPKHNCADDECAE